MEGKKLIKKKIVRHFGLPIVTLMPSNNGTSNFIFADVQLPFSHLWAMHAFIAVARHYVFHRMMPFDLTLN